MKRSPSRSSDDTGSSNQLTPYSANISACRRRIGVGVSEVRLIAVGDVHGDECGRVPFERAVGLGSQRRDPKAGDVDAHAAERCTSGASRVSGFEV